MHDFKNPDWIPTRDARFDVSHHVIRFAVKSVNINQLFSINQNSDKVVYKCFVEGCRSRSDLDQKTHTFHPIPTVVKHQGEKGYALSLARRRAWITAINRYLKTFKCIKAINLQIFCIFDDTFSRPNAEITKNTRICSDHFVTGKPASLVQTDRQDWVPSQFRIEENGKRCNRKSPESQQP